MNKARVNILNLFSLPIWRIILKLKQLIVFYIFIFISFNSHAEVQQSWRIRTTGKLRVSYPYEGKMSVKGWSQEQVSARLYSELEGTDPLKKNWSMFFFSRSQFMEFLLRSQSSLDNLKINNKNLRLELRVPVNSELEIWTNSADIFLQNISNKITMRGESGVWEVKNINSSLLNAYCESCDFKLFDSQGSIRYLTKNGAIQVENYVGKKIFLSSLHGDIKIKNTEGTHTLITKTGSILGEKNKGPIDFQAYNGMVTISQLNGEISGRSKMGKVQIHTQKWIGESEVGLETEEGDIQLSLPQGFDGWVDASSVEGQVFQNKKRSEPSFLEAIIFGKKGAFIKLSSTKGSIAIERR